MCHCEITSLVINCAFITTIWYNNEYVSLLGLVKYLPALT